MNLIDVCIDIWDCPHTTANDEGEGYPLVRTPNIGRGRFDLNGVHRVCEEVYNIRNKRAIPQDDDIVFAREAPAGNAAIIKNGLKLCLGQRIVLIRPNKEKVNPDFLTYFLLAPVQQHELLKTANGSTSSHVNMKTIRNLHIDLPSPDYQNKAASILYDYDELIEINNRRISILEEMAMRSYQEWFVHFRFPSHETTEFINGLPAGWEICKLEDLAYESGKPEKKKNRDKYKYYLPIDCLPRKSLTYSSTDVIENAESSLLSFDKYDILFGAMRPYFHKVVFARDKGLTRSTCFVLNAKDKDMWGYLLMLLFDERTIDFATQICTGSTMPYVLWDTLGRMDCIKPSKEVAKLYLNYIKPIIKELTNLISQNSDLQQMRDRLLPQLMSGQLEVTPNDEAL